MYRKLRQHQRMGWMFRLRKSSIFFLSVAIFSALFVPQTRNLILKPIWPKSWVPIGTLQVLKILFFTEAPVNVTKLECDNVQIRTLQSPALFDMKKCVSAQQQKYERLDKFSPDNPFLPMATPPERCDLISLYVELADILTKANISFFLVHGSLLGAYRHRGVIPWDDDIDISVNGSIWKHVRDTLSCIDGYELVVNPNMHWKFFRKQKAFPFIDIFFYTEDNYYIWAITHYVNKSLAYKKSYIFPLSLKEFEGLLVPLPGQLETIALIEYDPDYCQSPSLNHKNNTVRPIKTVLCSTLAHVYAMYNLRL